MEIQSGQESYNDCRHENQDSAAASFDYPYGHLLCSVCQGATKNTGDQAQPVSGGTQCAGRNQTRPVRCRAQQTRDCYALDYAFHHPRITPLLDANYKVVHVNVGKFDTNLDLAKKYSINLEKGIPNLAIIDSQEKVITSSPEFSKARVMTEDDVIDFLNKWKPGTK
jgi:hypothetical protein